jgi:hypothetical protein
MTYIFFVMITATELPRKKLCWTITSRIAIEQFVFT